MSVHTANTLLTFVDFFTALITLMVVLAILSQFVTLPYNRTVYAIRGFIDDTIQPMFAACRRILPSFGMIDLSPMVVLLALAALRQIAYSIINSQVS